MKRGVFDREFFYQNEGSILFPIKCLRPVVKLPLMKEEKRGYVHWEDEELEAIARNWTGQTVNFAGIGLEHADERYIYLFYSLNSKGVNAPNETIRKENKPGRILEDVFLIS